MFGPCWKAGTRFCLQFPQHYFSDTRAVLPSDWEIMRPLRTPPHLLVCNGDARCVGSVKTHRLGRQCPVLPSLKLMVTFDPISSNKCIGGDLEFCGEPLIFVSFVSPGAAVQGHGLPAPMRGVSRSSAAPSSGLALFVPSPSCVPIFRGTCVSSLSCTVPEPCPPKCLKKLPELNKASVGLTIWLTEGPLGLSDIPSRGSLSVLGTRAGPSLIKEGS